MPVSSKRMRRSVSSGLPVKMELGVVVLPSSTGSSVVIISGAFVVSGGAKEVNVR